MSDVPLHDYILKTKLGFQSQSLHYAAKSVSKDVAFAVDIPYPMLKVWREFLSMSPAEQGEEYEEADVDKAQGPVTLDMHIRTIRRKYQSYTDLFELAIPGDMFSIKKSESIRREMNDTLRKIAGTVKTTYLKAKGRKRYELDDKTRRFHMFLEYIQSVSQLEKENEELKERNEI